MKKRNTVLISIVILIFFFQGCSSTKTDTVIHQLDLKDQFFKKYDGSFILYNENENSYSIYNEKLVNERLSPLSTFKIANSLIGLESGVIKDKDYIYKWNGSNYPIESWNKDQTLETAIANSVVWYYQRLAQNVGEKAMQEYINKLDYGNKDISGGISKFWLSSSLKISAKEQVEFLKKLYNNQLPFSTDNMQMVREIITLESNEGSTLSGKTGTSGGDNELGWFVGIVTKDKNNYYFATNILGGKAVSGSKAKTITLEVLKYMEIYE